MTFTNYIRPICLPEKSDDNVDSRDHDFVTLTGWGKEKLNEIGIDGGLRRVALTIFPQG